MLPMSLRTKVMEEQYQQAKKAGLIVPLHKERRIKRFVHWFIVENRFPYDVAYKTCHLLLPKRQNVVYFNDMMFEELEEFAELIEEDGYIEEHYDEWKVNTKKKRSNMTIFHVHLNCFYDDREEMKL